MIGNPPYGVSIKGDYRKNIVKSLGNVPDFEIYYYFILIAELLLINRGVLSYIIPNTFLFNLFAAKFRLNLLEKWNLTEILDCTKFPIFESAVVRNTINTWQKDSDKDIKTIGYRNTAEVSSFDELIYKDRELLSTDELINMNQNWGLAFMLSPQIVSIVNRIKAENPILKTFFPEISQGLIAYDKYQGQSKEIIETRAYHFNTYHIGLKYWLWGEDVKKYIINWNQQEYISYCDGIANPREPKYFTGKRILIREITNPSIYASITEEELYNDPSIIIVKDNSSYSIKVCLAILNSKLATFYHFNHSPKATKGAFPKILVQDVKDFPLPIVNNETKQRIDSLVDYIISTKKSEPLVETSREEQEIDLLVYHLYGLTYDEVLIVDSETLITKEEYKRTE